MLAANNPYMIQFLCCVPMRNDVVAAAGWLVTFIPSHSLPVKIKEFFALHMTQISTSTLKREKNESFVHRMK